MNGLYFSGTGNTKHCMEKFIILMGNGTTCSIESPDAERLLRESEEIALGYPIHYSNMPLIMKDFVKCHANLFKGKKIFILCTMGLFSGDGAGLAKRILTKYGAIITGGLHIKMPDCIADVSLLKKTKEENQQIIRNADLLIEKNICKIKQNKYPKDGLSIFHYIAGLFGQRLWFLKEARSNMKKLTVNTNSCTGCSICSSKCPTSSITIDNGKAHFTSGKCTICYRCVNSCPNKAITIIGKHIVEQCLYENYTN